MPKILTMDSRTVWMWSLSLCLSLILHVLRTAYFWEPGLNLNSAYAAGNHCPATASSSPCYCDCHWKLQVPLAMPRNKGAMSGRNSQLWGCILDVVCIGSTMACVLKIPCGVLWEWKYNLTVVFGGQALGCWLGWYESHQHKKSRIECWKLCKKRDEESSLSPAMW